ncbi:TauD/TfdA family dioxygenase [Streptomyces sp. NBC_01381]|uniref:TauD/TfdA family dioxygenase n=1 Tax=Streptomyces sp. NBC_01381 TaxID=2903845 RepID=UPI0022526BD7|nr:TauD/TfdA family dioxygenase [Streptomyces sp. NBC_01381]MCX4670993.1 TauD/TfdA family dioxygenase [Streptomyces sp. NBC_01381]
MAISTRAARRRRLSWLRLCMVVAALCGVSVLLREAPYAVAATWLAGAALKVDFDATAALDAGAAAALERLRDAFVEASTSVPLRSGEMVFVDNRLAIHGRSAFTPRYDGQDRWLHRTFVLLDNRRTRGSRPGNGSILD